MIRTIVFATLLYSVAGVATAAERLFHSSFDSLTELEATNATCFNCALVDTPRGKGLDFSASRGTSYLRIPVMHMDNGVPKPTVLGDRGTIRLRVKPNWSGRTTTTSHYFVKLANNLNSSHNIGLFQYYDPGTSTLQPRNYLSFRYDSTSCPTGSCQREVGSWGKDPIPGRVMNWQPGEWHVLEIMWNKVGSEQFMLLKIDDNFEHVTRQNAESAFTSTFLWVGAFLNGSMGADAVIDDIEIFDQPLFDANATDKIAAFIAYKAGDGTWDPHESVANGSVDAPLIDEQLRQGRDVLFYTKPAFVPVYAGSLPTQQEIVQKGTVALSKAETEPLFINMYSHVALAGAQVALSTPTLRGAVPAVTLANATSVKVMKAWWQAGATDDIFKSLFPRWVSELLVTDDSVNLQGSWTPTFLPAMPQQNHATTSVAAKTSKQFVVNVTAPANATAGLYDAQLTVNGNGFSYTLPVEITIRNGVLEAADRDLLIYLRGRDDIPNTWADYVTSANYNMQLADLAAHGLNGVLSYGNNATFVTRAWANGLHRYFAFAAQNPPDYGYSTAKRDAILTAGYPAAIFYGLDEPNSDPYDRVPKHLARAEIVHNLNAEVVTAISKEFAIGINDPNSAIYQLYAQPADYERLDRANIAVYDGNTHTRNYFQGLLDGTRSGGVLQNNETYYWQVMIEDPRVNRYYAGIHLWLTEAYGIFPYAYAHAFGSNPFDDFDNAPNDSSGVLAKYRDHVVAYPSANGPIPTLQWEALREGIDDLRYLQTWQTLHDSLNESVVPSKRAAAVQSKATIDALLEKYRRYEAWRFLKIEDFAADRATIVAQLEYLRQF